MIEKDSTPAPSLVDVQLAFAHWRRTRPARESTPKRLKELAIGLLCSHSRSTVCEALAINSSALKQWADNDAPIAESVVEDFIELGVTTKRSLSATPGDLTIQLPNGVQIKTQGQHTLIDVLNAASSIQAAL